MTKAQRFVILFLLAIAIVAAVEFGAARQNPDNTRPTEVPASAVVTHKAR